MLRGWTRRELARRAHVDPKTLSTMFSGRRRPVLSTILAVCIAMGLALEDVIVFQDGFGETRNLAA